MRKRSLNRMPAVALQCSSFPADPDTYFRRSFTSHVIRDPQMGLQIADQADLWENRQSMGRRSVSVLHAATTQPSPDAMCEDVITTGQAEAAYNNVRPQ